ncbi:MAG: hypothetical protein ACE5OP_11955, partial [Candidatus Glassbacteria bacterium]
TFARHVRYAILPTYVSCVSRWPYNHLYESGSEGLTIISHIITEFVTTAAARHEIPLILVFPKRETLKIIQEYRKKPYKSLISFLETNDFSFIDFGDVFVEKNHSRYYLNDGHYSLDGNEVIANELINFIRCYDEKLETKVHPENEYL